MNAIEALEIAATEVVKALENAKCVNGSLLDSDQVQKEKRVMFWHRETGSLNASKKELLVIWSLPILTPVGRADDHVAIRRAEAYIDVFSRRDEHDKKTLDLLKKINEAFEGLGWSFEKMAYDSTDYIDGVTVLRYMAIRKV